MKKFFRIQHSQVDAFVEVGKNHGVYKDVHTLSIEVVFTVDSRKVLYS